MSGSAMHAVILSFACASSFFMDASASAEVKAIAYCEHNRPGLGSGQTAQEAREDALRHCNRGCCEVVIESNDKYPCVAFAYSNSNYAYNRAKNIQLAKGAAVMDCYQDGAHPDCKVIEASCANN